MNIQKAFLLGALAIAASACQPSYDTVTLTAESNPPAAASVRGNRVELAAGTAIVVHAKLRSQNETSFPGDGEFELYSADTSILKVYPRWNDEEFVLVGIAPGEVCIDVVVDGKLEDCIQTIVTAGPI